MTPEEEIAEHRETVEACKVKDLPIPITFESDFRGHSILIVNHCEKLNPGNGRYEKVPDTGFSIKFTNYTFSTQSRRIVELLMSQADYKNGKVRPNKEDPTGCWRQQKALKVETKQVLVSRVQGIIKLEGVDFDKFEKPTKPVEPLTVVAE